ncbi:MAG: UDP-N-acetylglucosamine 1-carboxyvinyltransferase [Hyphomicrobium zavarzinii]|jgi:UDP-N-acetylglucosamine 1-carboxyvinyltransferase|uniref:UDP-N-acetylglucosamine 1-carboxyvinyltransferase n=1 Tax=Hyphomicrobium TaxID=81 RepID=UPI00036B8C7A|nr:MULTISPECIES: UDP-N-acetylglucosamine 1-carboxyvinyltransferase [Hyphomicrobium]MBL8848003.1 UDP-N-acetylglucosamine 1-carboxyvinyltransferase [Hyphomicrobium zavarzinii]WBT38260.1 UDP-N-acetylglucosamine 1-carboxyvinyltransferase [Hyphomicrobium sp. DMF-1]HML43503.1 UDP-N-acetylglucosamine 1-carboxyvinyltransferase [Hyphomicrobium zavarzinii]
MDRIKIIGGERLQGSIPISGAKNAALPLMIASLLTDDRLTLKNVPNLADVNLLARILRNHGVDLAVDGKRSGGTPHLGETFHLTARDISDTTAPYELVSRMRASFWVLGPLVARMRKAKVSLPGGCAIGTRPVDLHLMGLKALGADIQIDGGYVIANAPNGLVGGHVLFPTVSVGATHNVLLAATLAKGETLIENAAREPEVGDVAACLVKMGAQIEGIGTSTLRIQGKPRLEGAVHTVLPDRIETGTFAFAVAATGGDVVLEGTRRDLLKNALDTLAQTGATVTDTDTGVRIARNGNGLQPVDVETQPFPGFPTDLQAQLMALMTRAHGTSVIRETIFENRFMHVQELARLGADIKLHGDTATIKGVKSLTGAPVMATDLRASVSLVIAGLMAEGETMINRVYHLDRGFERLEEKLSRCGAKIERLTAG